MPWINALAYRGYGSVAAWALLKAQVIGYHKAAVLSPSFIDLFIKIGNCSHSLDFFLLPQMAGKPQTKYFFLVDIDTAVLWDCSPWSWEGVLPEIINIIPGFILSHFSVYKYLLTNVKTVLDNMTITCRKCCIWYYILEYFRFVCLFALHL